MRVAVAVAVVIVAVVMTVVIVAAVLFGCGGLPQGRVVGLQSEPWVGGGEPGATRKSRAEGQAANRTIGCGT